MLVKSFTTSLQFTNSFHDWVQARAVPLIEVFLFDFNDYIFISKISNFFSFHIPLPAFMQLHFILLRNTMPSFISGNILDMLIFKICQPALQNFIWSKFMC